MFLAKFRHCCCRELSLSLLDLNLAHRYQSKKKIKITKKGK